MTKAPMGGIEALEWITVGPSEGDFGDARALKEILTEGELGRPDRGTSKSIMYAESSVRRRVLIRR